MDNINDRYNLVLLKHKEHKNFKDRYLIRKLANKYPDNEIYESEITGALSKRKLLDYMNSESIQDETGGFVYVNDLPKYYQTSELGNKALSNNLFLSEHKKNKTERLFRNVQIIGISIAALGGLITIYSFLQKHLSGLIN